MFLSICCGQFRMPSLSKPDPLTLSMLISMLLQLGVLKKRKKEESFEYSEQVCIQMDKNGECLFFSSFI